MEKPVAERATFDSLDALRGIAALVVTLWHFREYRPRDFPDGDFGGIDCDPGLSLYLSVDFFLVLSGFVLTHASDFACDDFDELCRRRYRFGGHRVARLMPMYLFAKVAAHISGLYLGWAGINGPDWTVMQDLLLSIVFALFVTPETPSWVLLLLSVACQGYVITSNGCLDIYSAWIPTICRCASSFFLGVCAHRLFDHIGGAGDSGGELPVNTFAATVLEASLMGCVVFVFVAPFRHLDFVAPWLFAVVIVCFAHQRGWLSQALCWVRFIGTISYSIYLNQLVVLMTLEKLGFVNGVPFLNALAMYWGLLFTYSVLTYFALEEPCRRLLRSGLDAILPVTKDSRQTQIAMPVEDPAEDFGEDLLAQRSNAPWYEMLLNGMFIECGCGPCTKGLVLDRRPARTRLTQSFAILS